jgi:hypothetical protein
MFGGDRPALDEKQGIAASCHCEKRSDAAISCQQRRQIASSLRSSQ